MEQRISLITLAVEDVERAATFYEAMGWRRSETPPGIVVFDLLGQSIGLYPKADLARDMGVDSTQLGTGAMTLAFNTRSIEEVTQVFDAAKSAGASVLKEPHDVFWGGHIAYVADLDGHVWEIAYNPFAPLRADGAFRWQGYEEH
ncbi:VOC family protein [Thalassovita sp.]|uniref:VOC family protein n=1 Tax=Thalassovita sp. TaxID=1979401 RepID=UPI002881BF5C|nr:VOC family protein [Thalassovita sp.]MDF1801867.1 VOC family protein [Thalassovita sp.]